MSMPTFFKCIQTTSEQPLVWINLKPMLWLTSLSLKHGTLTTTITTKEQTELPSQWTINSVQLSWHTWLPVVIVEAWITSLLTVSQTVQMILNMAIHKLHTSSHVPTITKSKTSSRPSFSQKSILNQMVSQWRMLNWNVPLKSITKIWWRPISATHWAIFQLLTPLCFKIWNW